jgi:thioester reductase-like protein
MKIAQHKNVSHPVSSKSLNMFQIYTLASSGKKLKPVHYISTLSIFEPNALFPISEATSLGSGEYLRGGYAQSKWVADKISQNACKAGIPVSIYR